MRILWLCLLIMCGCGTNWESSCACVQEAAECRDVDARTAETSDDAFRAAAEMVFEADEAAVLEAEDAENQMLETAWAEISVKNTNVKNTNIIDVHGEKDRKMNKNILNLEAAETSDPMAAGAACIHLNTAEEAELMKLPGVGRERAAMIVKQRTQRPFRKNRDLMRIKGIGKKTYKKIAPMLCDNL